MSSTESDRSSNFMLNTVYLILCRIFHLTAYLGIQNTLSVTSTATDVLQVLDEDIT